MRVEDGSGGEFIELKCAHKNGAGGFETSDNRGIIVRHQGTQHLRAGGHWHTPHGKDILQGQWYAVQGSTELTGGDLLLRLLRRLKSLLAKGGHKGIQARVQALKPIERCSSDVYRGDVFPTNLLCDVA